MNVIMYGTGNFLRTSYCQVISFSCIKNVYIYFSNVNITIYVVNHNFQIIYMPILMLKKADFIYILNAFTMCNNKHQN